jgi:hypothetical protein
MSSDFHIAIAETEEEKRAIYRFRYDIYVETYAKQINIEALIGGGKITEI